MNVDYCCRLYMMISSPNMKTCLFPIQLADISINCLCLKNLSNIELPPRFLPLKLPVFSRPGRHAFSFRFFFEDSAPAVSEGPSRFSRSLFQGSFSTRWTHQTRLKPLPHPTTSERVPGFRRKQSWTTQPLGVTGFVGTHCHTTK